ncbi:MAG: hypothetical protein OQL06_07585 [Gammaproteobacteria bacterium]|nr:hypothetical protein [Gammaproteobacteria bacterium]
MNHKRNILMLTVCFLLTATSMAHAGRQGVSFFYGLGLSAMAPQDDAVSSIGVTELDPSANAELILAFEEDGWAFEYSGSRGLESATDNAAIDYSASSTQLSLAYRTLETGTMYYKYRVGQMDIDFNYTGTTETLTTSGTVFGLGMGWRRGLDERMEVEYSLYSSSDIDTTHMLTLRYIWGGSPYEGDAF